MDDPTVLVVCGIIIAIFLLFVALFLQERVKKNTEEKIVYTQKNLRIHEELLYKMGYFHAIKNKPMDFDQCLKDLEELKKEVEEDYENKK